MCTAIRSNFNTREINSRDNHSFFGHNSEPCGNFWTILRHKLPIIHPDLPIPSNNLNSNVQPEFLNQKCLYKTEKYSRVLMAERNPHCSLAFRCLWLCRFSFGHHQFPVQQVAFLNCPLCSLGTGKQPGTPP